VKEGGRLNFTSVNSILLSRDLTTQQHATTRLDGHRTASHVKGSSLT
jgi:hypothetical protein